MSAESTYNFPNRATIHSTFDATGEGFAEFMKLTGTQLGITGYENLPDVYTGRVDAITHHESFDIIFHAFAEWVRTRRSVQYIAKDTLMDTPLVGNIIGNFGVIPINRDDGQAARDSVRKAAELAKDHNIVGIFDEGQRRNGHIIYPLLGLAKMTAIKAGVVIVPVGIVGRQNVPIWVPRSGHVHYGEPIEASRSKFFDAELKKHMQIAFDEACYQYFLTHGKWPKTGPLIPDKIKK